MRRYAALAYEGLLLAAILLLAGFLTLPATRAASTGTLALPPLPSGRSPLVPPAPPRHDIFALDKPMTSDDQARPTRVLLAAHFVRKSYRKGSIVIPVLQGVEFSVHEGEFVSIIGPSGRSRRN